MKNLKFFIAGFLLCFTLTFTFEVLAGVAGFKTSLISNVQANFTAGEQGVIRDSFVTAYQPDWNARVAAGTVDNAANRGIFAADKVIEFIQSIVKSEQYKASLQAVATPTPLP